MGKSQLCSVKFLFFSVTIAEDSLPVIPSQLIEEIVSVPSTASGALSAGCLSSAQSHTYNNAEATAEETHAKQPSFDREAQLVAGNQVILNSSRLLPEGTKIKVNAIIFLINSHKAIDGAIIGLLLVFTIQRV